MAAGSRLCRLSLLKTLSKCSKQKLLTFNNLCRYYTCSQHYNVNQVSLHNSGKQTHNNVKHPSNMSKELQQVQELQEVYCKNTPLNVMLGAPMPVEYSINAPHNTLVENHINPTNSGQISFSQTSQHYTLGFGARPNNIFNHNAINGYTLFKDFNNPSTSSKYSSNITSIRSFSKSSPSQQRNDDQTQRRYTLMDVIGGEMVDLQLMLPDREVGRPELLKSIRNKFMSFLLQSYYDHDYSTIDFLSGAKQAALVISKNLSDGTYENLEGLVEHKALTELRSNCDRLTDRNRKFLAIERDDVMLKYIYEIGMMFENNSDERFVEITTCICGMHGRRPDSGPYEVANPSNFYFAFYRFKREFTKGVEDSWTVNWLNHYRVQLQ